MKANTLDERAKRVLSFWIDEVGPKGWYKQDDAIDRRIAEEFGDIWQDAAQGRLDPWIVDPQGALALLILLDQFPRNMFRGTVRAYLDDGHARAIAKEALRMGHDLATSEPQRQFFYLPLMHSESLADQERSVRLILLRMPETGEENLDHAVKHREVIRKFSRFPSRNAALGRADSKAEIEYRENGGYMG